MSSLLTTLVRTPFIRKPYLTPLDPRTASSTGASVANVVYWMRLPRVNTPTLISTGYYFWASGAANGAMAILSADRAVITDADATAATYTAVASTASTAAAGASTWQAIAFTAPYWYLPGTDRWVAIGFDAAATIHRNSMTTSTSLLFGLAVAKASAYSSGIPASLSGSLITTAFLPSVVLA